MNAISMQSPLTAADYLTDPFYSMVDNPNFSARTQEAKMLVGVTGQGKTYFAAADATPYLFDKHDMDLVIYTYPQTEILDMGEWFKGLTATKTPGIQLAFNAGQAMDYLKAGIKVLLLTTHSGFVIQRGGIELIEYLKKSSENFSIWVDEAHTWMISDVRNYKRGMGHNVSHYEAKLFTALQELSVKTPYIFGLTATPNREARGVIEPIGNMKLSVINDFPPKELLISSTSWLSSTSFYDPKSPNAEWEMWDLVENAVIKLYDDYFKTGIKKTMMVPVGNEGCSSGLDSDFVKRQLLRIIDNNALAARNERTIAVMTSNKQETGTFSYNRPKAATDDDENSIKDKLIDQEDALRIVIVKQKGRMGMNVPTLGSLVYLKSNDNKDDLGPFTESPIQIMGRLVRLNTGIDKGEFTEKYGYNLTKYVKSLTRKEKNNLVIANSIDMVVPKTDMWVDSSDEFAKTYVSSVQQAKAWMRSI
tara:strand:- start:49 stop:1476 length:1428 start_codon:yes stop_codon:yes gene_type:complete